MRVEHHRILLCSLAAAFILAGTLGTNASILVLGAADAAGALVLLLSGVKLMKLVPRRLSSCRRRRAHRNRRCG